MHDPSCAAPFGRLRCHYCDDVIGVYEPLVVLGVDGSRATSLAAEPSLLALAPACAHAACHAAAAPGVPPFAPPGV